jgi:hypothetical protein
MLVATIALQVSFLTASPMDLAGLTSGPGHAAPIFDSVGFQPPSVADGCGSHPPRIADGGGSHPPRVADGGGSHPPRVADGGGSHPPRG